MIQFQEGVVPDNQLLFNARCMIVMFLGQLIFHRQLTYKLLSPSSMLFISYKQCYVPNIGMHKCKTTQYSFSIIRDFETPLRCYQPGYIALIHLIGTILLKDNLANAH